MSKRRTYLKSSSDTGRKTCAGISKLLETERSPSPHQKVTWRGKNSQVSLESPEIVLKSKKVRKPLSALNNLSPQVTGTSIAYSDQSFRSPPSLTVSADNTFDKLFVASSRDDPFDQLFKNVKNKVAEADPFDRLFDDKPLSPTKNQQEYFASVFSTPSETECSTDKSNQSGPGLFSSFSKQDKVKTPCLKKKSRNIRTKKKSNRNIIEPRETVLSETLSVEVVFQNDDCGNEVASQQRKYPSSGTLLLNSPFHSCVRAMNTLSVATSTPVLSSRSSEISLSEPSPPVQGFLSPVQDVHMVDEVFMGSEAPANANVSPPVSHLSSTVPSRASIDEYFEPTPPPQKSFVNRSRGNRIFGGPAASLMNHIGWRLSMHSIRGDTKSTGADEEDTSRSYLTGSVMEDEDQAVQEVTVTIGCVCGYNQMTNSQVIQCLCGMWFHTDCMGLTESAIEEIVGDELDWYCKGCIEEAQNNPDRSKNFTLSSPSKGFRQVDASQPDAEKSNTSFVTHVTDPPSALANVNDSVDISCLEKSQKQSSSLSSSIRDSSHRSFFRPITTHDHSWVASQISPPSNVVTVSPITSPLSVTAQLELQHQADEGEVGDASLMFVKPAAPPKRKNKHAVEVCPTVSPNLQLRAGKNWKRSILGARGSMCEVSRVTLPSVECLGSSPVNTQPRRVSRATLSSTECLGSLPAETLPRRSTRHAQNPLLEESLIFPTPQKSTKNVRQSRSAFCIVPSTPRLTEYGKQDTRLSVLQTLSETLLCDSEASFAPEVTRIDIIPSTPLDKLLRACSSQQVQLFDSIYPPETIKGSTKIGEGAFGEVFLLGAEGDERPVLKIVPIDGNIKVNGEEQTKIEDMLSEVIISDALSKLRIRAPNMTSGFVEVRGCHVFRGVYPPQLLALWDKFNEEHESENDRPDNLPSTQMYIALEFNNAGKDLEKFTFKHASQALQAWKQVAHSLAVAEEELQFEHRDLHWGNVLVKETTEKYVQFTIGGDVYLVETCGVVTSIIDFSLSRLSLDKVTIFNNLSDDPTLFSARGLNQPGGDYQFDIYRKMKEYNNNEWEAFHAKTNIYWLDYMLDKMLTEVYYSSKKTTKPNRSGFSKMRNLRSNLSHFNCVADWVRREGDRLVE